MFCGVFRAIFIVSRVVLTYVSINLIRTVYDMGIRKPGDGMRLQLAVLKFHILGKSTSAVCLTKVKNTSIVLKSLPKST